MKWGSLVVFPGFVDGEIGEVVTLRLVKFGFFLICFHFFALWAVKYLSSCGHRVHFASLSQMQSHLSSITRKHCHNRKNLQRHHLGASKGDKTCTYLLAAAEVDAREKHL